MTTERRRRPGKLWARLAVVLALALVAAACDTGEDVDTGITEPDDTVTTEAGEDPDEATDTTEAVEEMEGGVLIAAQGAEPERFDPHLTTAFASFQVLENVYDTLVQPGADLSMEPALATDWEISDDGLTWTFNLREGVNWHNGREFTADDVVFSYERIMDPDEGAQNQFRFASVEEVVAVDDLTVDIHLTRPTPNLLVNIGAFKGMAIVPQEIVDDGTIDTAPVGTGPFKFVSYTPGDGVVLERNDDYWRADEGLPHLDGIQFRAIPDATVKLTALQTGEVHWVDGVPPAQIAELANSDDVVLEQVPGGDYHYFALNQAREPFDNRDVRQAIAMAIDRDSITEAATFGAGTANQAAIPDGNFWYHSHAPYGTADVDGATTLLEDAGVSDLTIELMVSSDFPETVTQAQVIASQLEAIGVTVVIADVDSATWFARQADGEFDAFMLSWIGNIDPDDFYYAQHHSEGGFNFQGQNNPDLDALLDQARVETDPDARKALYDQAAEMIVDDASYIYLYNPDNINAWSPAVEGYFVRGDNAVRFEDTSLGG